MYCQLRKDALDRHREKLFGDADELTIYGITPETGETILAVIKGGWMGQRTQPLTDDGSRAAEAGTWQFQIAADDDWRTSQTFMDEAVALVADGQRFRIKKREKPIGTSLVWKVKAEMQD